MKTHEKAYAYGELMKDIDLFITELQAHSKSIEAIGADESGKEDSSYYAAKCGRLLGNNFGLDLKIQRMLGTLNWYKNQK